jgi:hypothetical protein
MWLPSLCLSTTGVHRKSCLCFQLASTAATALLGIAIGLIVIVEIATTLGYDKYHGENGTERSAR